MKIADPFGRNQTDCKLSKHQAVKARVTKFNQAKSALAKHPIVMIPEGQIAGTKAPSDDDVCNFTQFEGSLRFMPDWQRKIKDIQANKVDRVPISGIKIRAISDTKKRFIPFKNCTFDLPISDSMRFSPSKRSQAITEALKEGDSQIDISLRHVRDALADDSKLTKVSPASIIAIRKFERLNNYSTNDNAREL